MNIDFSQAKSAQVREEKAMLDRRNAAKDECKRRITAILSETAQLNIAADAVSGRMSETELAALAAWRHWVDGMRSAWPLAAEVTAPAEAEGLWPKVPLSVATLTDKY